MTDAITVYNHPDSAVLVHEPPRERMPTKQPLSSQSVAARTDDPHARLYSHRDSQVLHHGRKDVYADATRTIYNHPSSQEKLFFPDDLAIKEKPAKEPAKAEPEKPTESASQPLKSEQSDASQSDNPDFATALFTFDEAIKEAQRTGDADALALLKASKMEASRMLFDFGVSGVDATTLVNTLSEYIEPRDDAALAQQASDTMTYLRWMWGDQTEGRIEAANRIADEACTRLPWLRDVLMAGAGNDVRVIQKFTAIAQKRGYF